MKRFDGVTPWAPAPPPGAEVRSEQPARAGSLAADLWLPLGQAVASGFLVGTLAGFVAKRAGYTGSALELGGFVGLAVAVLCWAWLLADTRRLLWSAERLIGIDLSRDGHIGEPPSERIIIANAPQARREAAAAVEAREAAVRRSQFAQFIGGIPVRGTAMAPWERAGVSRDQYRAWRDLLLRLNWARWNSVGADGQPNETQGWALTLPASEILERLSDG
jgi:hypothetical protein